MNKTDTTPKQVVNKQYESLVYDIEEYIDKTDYDRTERKFLRQLESLEQVVRELKYYRWFYVFSLVHLLFKYSYIGDSESIKREYSKRGSEETQPNSLL